MRKGRTGILCCSHTQQSHLGHALHGCRFGGPTRPCWPLLCCLMGPLSHQQTLVAC